MPAGFWTPTEFQMLKAVVLSEFEMPGKWQGMGHVISTAFQNPWRLKLRWCYFAKWRATRLKDWTQVLDYFRQHEHSSCRVEVHSSVRPTLWVNICQPKYTSGTTCSTPLSSDSPSQRMEPISSCVHRWYAPPQFPESFTEFCVISIELEMKKTRVGM